MIDKRIKEIVTPEGIMTVEEFIRTLPPGRQEYFLNQIEQINRRRIENQKWVDQQLQDSLDVSGILYKYIPCCFLQHGCPNSLRATQLPALNDVMEGNIEL